MRGRVRRGVPALRVGMRAMLSCLHQHRYTALMPPRARTITPRKAPLHRRQGRPAMHAEAWSKVSVDLFDRQVTALEGLAAGVRRKTHRMLNRASIIRCLIDGLLDSRLDLSAAASEVELAALIRRNLKRTK